MGRKKERKKDILALLKRPKLIKMANRFRGRGTILDHHIDVTSTFVAKSEYC